MNAVLPVRTGRDAAAGQGAGVAPAHIVVRDLVKRYGHGKAATTALADVSVSIARGEFVSILGPSGCGKSTLLMIVAGLVGASTGTVEVAGRAVTSPLTDLGIVFQRDLLFDWRTILDNVLLQADVRGIDRKQVRPKAMQLLASVGLAGFEQARPSELSGGMRQRAALCRALLHDAPLLLMDEPFGALDAITRDQINLDLQDIWLRDARTAVLITHSISEAVFLSDRVLVMSPRPGRIVKDVTIDLPRPRTIEMRDRPAFIRHQAELREAIAH